MKKIIIIIALLSVACLALAEYKFNPVVESGLDYYDTTGSSMIFVAPLSRATNTVTCTAATTTQDGCISAASYSVFNAKQSALGFTPLDTAGSNTLTADLQFNKYKAIAMACDNGTSFPGSPVTGQWFYRSDIKTLFLYESAWKAIISFAAVNLYVDGTNGSDAVGQGYSSGSGAAKTVQYAIDLIPSTNGGSVIVNVAAGTYWETVTIQGKTFSGNYTITILGVLSNIVTGTATNSSATTLTTSLNRTLNQDAGKLLRITSGTTVNNAIILSNTAGPNTVYTVEKFSATPTSTCTFSIDDWATRVTGANVGADTTAVRSDIFIVTNAQQGIVIDSMKLNYSTQRSVYVIYLSSCTVKNCEIHNCRDSLYAFTYANMAINSCYLHNNTRNGIYCIQSSVNIFDSYLKTHSGGSGVQNINGSFSQINRSRIDTAFVGINNLTLSYLGVNAASTVTNCTTGFSDDATSIDFAGFSAITYTSNTTNYVSPGLFSTGGTRRTPYHTVEGSVALVAGTAVITLTAPASFSGATSYTVNISRTITTALVGVVNNSGTQFTITSANLLDTDTVRFTAIGD